MARFISGITLTPDYGRIFSRLGYKKRSTELGSGFKEEIVAWIDEAAAAVRLTAAATVCTVEKGKNSGIIFTSTGAKGEVGGVAAGKEIGPSCAGGNPFSVTSRSLSAFLCDSEMALVIGITAGSGVMELIEECQKRNMTKAVVMDAAAGEITDSGLDFVVSLYNRELTRSGRSLLPKRFSPGYGDLSIETQASFYPLLEMEKLGVKLSSSMMLIPQKSVIAITGIV